jgi:hypothetical protein
MSPVFKNNNLSTNSSSDGYRSGSLEEMRRPPEIGSPSMAISGKTIVMLSKNRELRPVRASQDGATASKLLSFNPKERLMQKRQTKDPFVRISGAASADDVQLHEGQT